ncbi:hypothetical protein [Mycobacterium interjectum]|uniref:hypothetical protein n=1 Tax=Mycobacterium interjectum TaxID=33895 RepID=UPI00135855CA|nr:hypothetical protein [Mycobacterium interjectum]
MKGLSDVVAGGDNFDYRSRLPGGAARSPALSGMAIGPHRVYLTPADTPYVISVAKPQL